ncbi:MAG: DUF2478 domain-containing protein [Phycisphaerales bacterium]|nr:MAG: DUF2478 domain-containing protein [Phycisphaerales bacterium]
MDSPARAERGRKRYRGWPSLLFWTGPKHSGKTTAAAHLIAAARAEGLVVTGCLALSVYEMDRLVGFDLLDLQSNARLPLARRQLKGPSIGRFHFLPEALKHGRGTLTQAARQEVDLVVVDEYGPLELAHQGWRSAVDTLITATDTPLLLVVRQELIGQLRRLYATIPCMTLPAAEPQSIEEALGTLRTIRSARKSEIRKLSRPGGVPVAVAIDSDRQVPNGST